MRVFSVVNSQFAVAEAARNKLRLCSDLKGCTALVAIELDDFHTRNVADRRTFARLRKFSAKKKDGREAVPEASLVYRLVAADL